MRSRRAVPLMVERWWECPSCAHQARTTRGGILTPMHRCPEMSGLEVPLVQVLHNGGIRSGDVRHVAVERGDMIGQERGVLVDARGKAIQSVITERRDGSYDCTVFAPVATASAS
jgi:hypothetical protein